MSNPDGLNPTGCRSGRRTEALGSGASNVVSLIPGLMAMTLISMIPVLITFYISQRYFIQGIVISGIKG